MKVSFFFAAPIFFCILLLFFDSKNQNACESNIFSQTCTRTFYTKQMGVRADDDDLSELVVSAVA